MRRKLVKTGNSDALIITKEMKEHLGVRESIAVYYAEGQIVLKKPTSFEEARDESLTRFDEAYRKLAE